MAEADWNHALKLNSCEEGVRLRVLKTLSFLSNRRRGHKTRHKMGLLRFFCSQVYQLADKDAALPTLCGFESPFAYDGLPMHMVRIE